MKRLLVLFCTFLTTLGLPGCDYFNARDLTPGVSTADEVRIRFGPPQAEWRNDDGSVTWEYSRQPEGAECYMITIGPDRVLRSLEQVLNEAVLARVQPGMEGDQVQRLIGRPASRQRFELKHETVWEWLIDRGSHTGELLYFTATFDDSGRVTATGRYTRHRNG